LFILLILFIVNLLLFVLFIASTPQPSTAMIIPTIFQTQPDHSHIKLHSLKLRPAMKFMDQLHEYLTEHRIALRIPNSV
jgi:hypothetical protein